MISSNIAYILLNKEKKIQGISSSCMKMMNFDDYKMRRLTQNGIDINKLAPQLFDEDHSDYSFTQKQGGTLDWYMIEHEKVKKSKADKYSNNRIALMQGDQSVSSFNMTHSQIDGPVENTINRSKLIVSN